MSHRLIIIPILVLALVTMACGITINLPVTDYKTGPTTTETISVPQPPTDGPVELSLKFGAGKLELSPGATGGLVEGDARYNVVDLRPEIQVEGNSVQISTGDLEISGIPRFGNELINTWDLKLAATPMRLTVSAGAYQGDLELGGLALERLEVTDGASDVHLRFSEPNQVAMERLQYETGASSVRLSGLGYANFENLVFKGGVGDYTLDFSGTLQRDGNVRIDAGASSVTVIVPQGVAARVFFDGGLANVDVSGDWDKNGDEYSLAGSGPRLTINVNLGAGNLDLRNR